MLEQKYISGQSAVKIARSIEAAVAAGKIAAGDKLSPVRELAKHLGVSGATVAAAYRNLQDRGVTTANRRRGTRIRPTAPAAPRRARSRRRQPRSRAAARSAAPPPGPSRQAAAVRQSPKQSRAG